jgi:DNA-3-methyladenine glycosylase
MAPTMDPLDRSVLARDADEVARDLLGRLLVRERDGSQRVGRIVEAEAYFGPAGAHDHLPERGGLDEALALALAERGDPASHSHGGRTERTETMWGPPGYAYVYRIYGIHDCLNVSTGRWEEPGSDPVPEAVLIRAIEPVEGLEEMLAARGVDEPDEVGSGPGKLTDALEVTRAQDGADLTTRKGHNLWLAEGETVGEETVAQGSRVGVEDAEDWPLRWWVKASDHVSR